MNSALDLVQPDDSEELVLRALCNIVFHNICLCLEIVSWLESTPSVSPASTQNV